MKNLLKQDWHEVAITYAFIIILMQTQGQSNCDWSLKEDCIDFPTSFQNVTTGWNPYAPFSDDFNGSFDYSKWIKKDSFCHSMSTHAYFRNVSDNVSIEAGKLKLMAKYEGTPTECCIWNDPNDCHDFYYSSGYVKSVNTIQYGFIEVKCYLPNELALNPCFWLWGQTTPYEYDEIDVFERFKNPIDLPQYNHSKTMMQNFYHNVHDNATISKLQQNIYFTTPFLGQESIYAVEWLPEEIHFYVNGHITRSVRYSSRTDLNSSSYFTCTNFLDAIPMTIDLSFSVNHAVTPSTDLSRGFEIEYVRSYKLKEGFNYQYWPTSFSLTDPNIFKVHKSLKLGGSGYTALIPSNQNITVWAKDYVILDQGFQVSGNTIFTARCIKSSPALFN